MDRGARGNFDQGTHFVGRMPFRELAEHRRNTKGEDLIDGIAARLNAGMFACQLLDQASQIGAVRSDFLSQ